MAPWLCARREASKSVRATVRPVATRSARLRPKVLAAALLAGVCLLAAAPSGTAAPTYPDPGPLKGFTGISDPSMVIKPVASTAVGDPRYVVYGTGNVTLTSEDRFVFAYAGKFMPLVPMWWGDYRSDDDVWAPDVSFHNGKYWLYYAVSKAVGSKTSAIGFATSPTGLPGTWTDVGKIFFSKSTDDYNAIDPNLFVDSDGSWWLTFGSFWSGIWTMPLDRHTGRPTDPPTLYHLAERPRSPSGPSYPGPGIEAPFIYKKGSYYYLFVSFDKCCDGVNSTYNIRVGRSLSVTGPYVDATNTDMRAGGGNLILATHGAVVGPGGQSVYHDDYLNNRDLLVYHYYDGQADGRPKLGINFLDFGSGFPVVF